MHNNWDDAGPWIDLPDIDWERLYTYRINRLREQLVNADASMCILVNPISLRYAVDYRTYGLFQSHIPTTYLFLPVNGPLVIYNAYSTSGLVDYCREGQAINFFDGGYELQNSARKFADDVVNYLHEIGSQNTRIAIEYINPEITIALMDRGIEVIDGVIISESARVIKSPDEIACMRRAIAVAEHGIDKLIQAIRPGVSELQLWGLLNYVNIANNGDWHEGKMLASGPRINPWLQEASPRKLETGDLVGFDTDMVGPYGYFADISRTVFCGPGQPTKRQKQLYQLAVQEIEHNLEIIRPGVSFSEFRNKAFVQEECFHQNAYPCLIHGVGMCDEYPRINPVFHKQHYEYGQFEAGMVICVESYVGALGERDGVKLEQQILLTDNGYELLSNFPLDESLLN